MLDTFPALFCKHTQKTDLLHVADRSVHQTVKGGGEGHAPEGGVVLLVPHVMLHQALVKVGVCAAL